MPGRKNTKKSKEKSKESQNLSREIAEAVRGLIYLIETDAEITVFEGQRTDSVTGENLLSQTGKKDVKVEEKDFHEFFRPLTELQDWFGEDERKMTEKFRALKILLQQNLVNKKVFRLGKKEIDIYVVGLDREGILRGIQTKAVET